MNLRLPLLLLAPALLSACAGMNEAVTVLPNTLDDLAAKTEPFRRGREAKEGQRVEPPRVGF